MLKQRHLFSIGTIFLIVAGLGLCSSNPSTAATPKGYVPGRFIIKVKPDARVSRMMQAAAGSGTLEPLSPAPAKAGAEQFSRYYVFCAMRPDMTADAVATSLGSTNIERIEQDQYLELYGFPTDSLFPDQWYLYNTGQSYLGINRIAGVNNDTQVLKQGTPGVDMHISRYYQTPPSETTKVTVAIVDTGEDFKHPELKGRFWKNPGEIPNNGIDDDHNGYVDDTVGYDLSGDTSAYYNIVGDNDPTDQIGHGTHLAGIIAANADGRGIVGVAPWVQIMPVKIYPNAYMSIGTAGILYAVNAGARIINISWGSPFESFAMQDALSFARANGVFVSIAAGNTGDNTRGYPAASDSAFTVAAGDSHGYMASFSTFGPFVSLVAPGVDILSLRAAGTDLYAAAGEPGVHIVGPDSLYYLADGTSMAAPAVAGAAALIWSMRPDLSLPQLENILKMGAIDMIDPRNEGDSLPGPDTISGYGYLCVQCSMDLLTNGGVALTAPISRSRLSGDVAIKAAPVANYTGSWLLQYSVGEQSQDWQPLGQESTFPPDSTIAHFNHPEINNVVNFRITDQFGTSKITAIRYINTDSLALISPDPGDTLRFSIPVDLSVFGTSYDSLTISYRAPAGDTVYLFSSTNEYFSSPAFTWNVSGVSTGYYDIIVRGYFHSGSRSVSARIYMASAFAAGWPQKLPARGGQTVISADLFHDGKKELILGTFYGLYAYRSNGQLLPHFPILPSEDMRCLPAIYDVDGDGYDEIVCTNADGLHAFKPDGTEVKNFPVLCPTGTLVFGYPTPTIARLTPSGPVCIMFIDISGTLRAFRCGASPEDTLIGRPVFYSTQTDNNGLFAYFNPNSQQPLPAYFFGGNELSAVDFTGDGWPDVVATYASILSPNGIAVFNGKNGTPAFSPFVPQVLTPSLVFGSTLGDLNGDSIPEIVVTGEDLQANRVVWVLTRTPDGKGMTNLPGWPIVFPEASGWLGNIPTIADLDLDGRPEILFTFYGLDKASLYAFHADGTPYNSNPGRPNGELFTYPMTFGVPIVADLTGDRYPEIIFRGGYILPGSGTEKLFVLDHEGQLLPGYPIPTPAAPNEVISSPFAPMVDDIDGSGHVDLVFSGDGGQIYVWNFDASSNGGQNHARLGYDNLNSHIYKSPGIPTDVVDHPNTVPLTFALGQNYPNPFNPSTTISFELSSRARARLDVYNVLGQMVRILVNDDLAAGTHSIRFESAGLASGLYFYRLSAGDHVAVKKMVLLK